MKEFCFKLHSVQTAKWTVCLQHGLSATLAKVIPKRSPKRHPPTCLGLNQVGTGCCPDAGGWTSKHVAVRGPEVPPDCPERPGTGQAAFTVPVAPLELLKFPWSDSHCLLLRKRLGRDNTSQCSNCSLPITCYFTGTLWGNSALSSSLCFGSVYHTIKFEYFQLPFTSNVLEADNTYM